MVTTAADRMTHALREVLRLREELSAAIDALEAADIECSLAKGGHTAETAALDGASMANYSAGMALPGWEWGPRGHGISRAKKP